MTRREFLERLRERGFSLKPYQITTAVDCGHIERPAYDGQGNLDYQPEHVDQMIAYLESRARGQVANSSTSTRTAVA
jgi:hypothetical protein